MSEFRDNPKFKRVFDLDNRTLLGLAVRIADAAMDNAAKIKPWPCPAWCTLGEHPYRPRQISGDEVERTHQMKIHEETTSHKFDAVILQDEYRYMDGHIELGIPFAKIKANADHVLKPDDLIEFAKTMELTAENLRRIQQ